MISVIQVFSIDMLSNNKGWKSLQEVTQSAEITSDEAEVTSSNI